MPSIWQDLYKVFQPKPLQFCLPTNRFTYDTKKSTAPERLAGKQAQGTCGTQRFAPSTEDELWVLSFAEQVNAISSNKGRIYAAMEIGNKTFEMQMDTEVSCNVPPRSYLPADAEIQKTMRKLVTYSKSKLRVLGTVIAPVRNPRNNVEYTEECVVVVDASTPLLGAEACIK